MFSTAAYLRLGPPNSCSELIVGRPGSLVIQKSGKERVDLGNQVGLLTDRDIEPDTDGRFTVYIDPQPANERKYHLRSRDDCPQALLLRDTLSDWSQVPLEYRIEKVAGPSGPPLTGELIAERTMADLPEWVDFWTKFKENWMGNPAANTMATPIARDGGWGFGASGPYELADDEALIATVSKGNAPYASIQIIDRWLIGADPRLDFANLNISQTTPNADGTVTYVVSVKDPGVVNWASTGGQHRGYIFLRWQGTPRGHRRNEAPQGVSEGQARGSACCACRDATEAGVTCRARDDASPTQEALRGKAARAVGKDRPIERRNLHAA